MAPKLKYNGSNYRLTEEEKAFAEENHNLIYDFFHKKKLEIDEYYGEAATGYIISVMEYNRRPELQKYSFSTIAYKKMFTSVWNAMESKRRYQAHIEYSLDDSEKYGKLKDYTADTNKYFCRIEQEDEIERILRRIMPHLTRKQWEILIMKIEGYKMNEIMKKQKRSFVDYFRDEAAIKQKMIYISNQKK